MGGAKVIYFGTCADFGHGLLRSGPRDDGSAFDILWNHLGGCPRLKCPRPGATGIVQAWLSKILPHRHAKAVRVMFIPHRQGQVSVNAMMRRIELPSWGRQPERFNAANHNVADGEQKKLRWCLDVLFARSSPQHYRYLEGQECKVGGGFKSSTNF